MLEIDNIPFDVRSAAFLAAGLVIGASIMFLGLNSDVVSKESSANKLVSVLEKQSGTDLEIVNVKEEKGLYRADIKDSENQLSTYYITRDGESFTQSISNIGELDTALDAQANFSNCLENKNVVLYGNISERTTQLQIQALGGTQTVQPIYKDVGNNRTLIEALENGVTRTPSFYYEGSTLEGVNQLQSIEEFTGCSLSNN